MNQLTSTGAVDAVLLNLGQDGCGELAGNTTGLMVQVGIARGIPRPSFLEVPDLFALLDSRGIDSITPRILGSSPKFLEDLENTKNTKKYNIFWKNSTKKI